MRIPGERVKRTRLIQTKQYVVAVEVEMVIPVDPISGRSAAGRNSRGLRRSIEHLRNRGMLVIFPAGEVAHFRWRLGAVTDAEWNPIVPRLLSIEPAAVVPMYVAGKNGPMFQIAGMLHPALRTALLGRELLNKRGRRIEVHVGSPIAAEKLLAHTPSRRARTIQAAHGGAASGARDSGQKRASCCGTERGRCCGRDRGLAGQLSAGAIGRSGSLPRPSDSDSECPARIGPSS